MANVNRFILILFRCLGITDLLIVLQTEANTHKCCLLVCSSSMLVAHTLHQSSGAVA